MAGQQPDRPSPSEGQPDSENTSRSALISSGDLLKGSAEVHIDHNGDIYRLRVTRAGKLILTK